MKMKQHEATTMTIQQSNKELALTCINNLFVGFGTNQERMSMGWTSRIYCKCCERDQLPRGMLGDDGQDSIPASAAGKRSCGRSRPS